MMDVILLERIEKLGQMGDVVKVKPGFARNYLLPQKKALRATDRNRQLFEKQRAQLEAVNLEQRGEAEAFAGRLDGLSVVIVRQASDNDQLYGSVTVRDIAQAVTEAGFSVDSKQVQLARPIKTVGLHEVIVRLHPEVGVTVKANVARTVDEAEMQAAGRRVTRAGEEEPEEAEEAGERPLSPWPSAHEGESGEEASPAGEEPGEPEQAG